ncbi:PTS system mannose/fructose/sorbose family transporter subunit IID [Lactococcus ileimucosae]|uniref:PTS system mannose/fructose/sorbose family transporter subunit IID n=1 Tax=Lactococcus ileimucosae TaxID=2941329 RepID=A0ABV4D983_9LACT
MTNTKKPYKLTDKDFRQINLRSMFFFQSGWNYERMQGSGYLYHILPQLRKIYGDNTPELKEMMKTHTQFFNTSNFFNTIITGIDLAVEEKQGIESKPAVEGLKTGLLGPFAAVGDSMFAIVTTITGALAANMAMQENPAGILIAIAVQMVWLAFRFKQVKWAYNKGTSLVSELSSKFETLIDSATLMGVFMVGAMIASVIRLKIAFAPKIGEVPLDIQNNLDMILPGLLPALIVGFAYWLLGKKGMTNLRVLLIVLLIAIILGATGIMVKG